MIRPVRLQLRRKKGFDLQAHSRSINGLPAKVVTRPGIFGNPWKIGRFSRKTVVELHRSWITCERTDEEIGEELAARRREVLRRLPQLRGYNLACVCSLPAPGESDVCHACILIELANPTEEAA